MPYETILTDLSESIFTITINRPDKLNALNTQMIHDLIAALDEADADDAVRAIIVTGAGTASRIFPTRTRATAADASPCASSTAASR
jgi:enoyl-CoA hydratase/carnithine racemase